MMGEFLRNVVAAKVTIQAKTPDRLRDFAGMRLAITIGMATNLSLCAVPVFFASSEGQTRRIADRIATLLQREGLDSRPYDMASLGHATLDWSGVRAAVVGASIHVGRHQPAAHAFVSAHVGHLNATPSAFFSVSLAAASQNREEVHKAQELADNFPPACHWHPQTVASLAGRLAYTQYGFFTRLAMKRIARKEGAPTDTSRDYEFTNWDQVDALARELVALVKARLAA